MVETAVRRLSTPFLMTVLSCSGRTPSGVGWMVYRLDGYEFEQVPRVGDGQGSLACCTPWGHKESDTAERLSNDWQGIFFIGLPWWLRG